MRTAFINELTSQARSNTSIFLIVGDIGFSVVEAFASEFPDRFLNVGVAEQNMVGIAAGLAMEGYQVFTYSIANFPTLRCLEQIRNDIGYNKLPVAVVALGAGVAYGNLGYSHHAVQDIGVIRSLESLLVLSPGDPGETRECVQWLVNNPAPAYLRIGKAGEPDLHEVRGISEGPLEIRRGGGRFAIASTGSVLSVALDAARLLDESGISVSVFSCPWLHPVTADFFSPLADFEHVITVEEHLPIGGLASTLRDTLGRCGNLHSVCLKPELAEKVGTQRYLRAASGLDSGSISALVRRLSVGGADVKQHGIKKEGSSKVAAL